MHYAKKIVLKNSNVILTSSKRISNYKRGSKFFRNFWEFFWKFLKKNNFLGIFRKLLGIFLGILREFSGNSTGIFWEFFWHSLVIWIAEHSLGILWEFWIAYWHKIVNVTWNDANFDWRRDRTGQQKIKSFKALLQDRA